MNNPIPEPLTPPPTHPQRKITAGEGGEASDLARSPSPSVGFGWGGRRSGAAAVGVLPTGTVTFLFTDIQGSTPLWERAPELTNPLTGAEFFSHPIV
jgi:class 3 adenylate cyclase